MIRAHLATFPPRRALMLDVAARMAPQVDTLVVVLNDYETVPEELATLQNVQAILPDRDVKDAGKFWTTPAPDDIVFLIDDDLAYPADYVAQTLAQIDGCDLSANVFAYQGNAWIREDGRIRTDSFMFRQPHDTLTGAGLVGTGTVCTLGRNVPGLDVAESAAGFVDVRFAAWLHQRAVLPWILPRARKWITSMLPKEMKANSLYQTVHRAQPGLYVRELGSYMMKWPHMGQTYSDYYARAGVPS